METLFVSLILVMIGLSWLNAFLKRKRYEREREEYWKLHRNKTYTGRIRTPYSRF